MIVAMHSPQVLVWPQGNTAKWFSRGRKQTTHCLSSSSAAAAALLLTIGRRYSASSFAPLPGDKEARTSEAWSTAAPWKEGGGGQERTGVALSR